MLIFRSGCDEDLLKKTLVGKLIWIPFLPLYNYSFEYFTSWWSLILTNYLLFSRSQDLYRLIKDLRLVLDEPKKLDLFEFLRWDWKKNLQCLFFSLFSDKKDFMFYSNSFIPQYNYKECFCHLMFFCNAVKPPPKCWCKISDKKKLLAGSGWYEPYSIIQI